VIWRVVPLEARHLPSVLTIEAASYPRPWTRAGFRHELEANPVALCRAVVHGEPPGERLGGYLFCWSLGEELRINNIAVHPDLRRRGLARVLLKAVTAEARAVGCRRVTLEVRSRNAGARSLYEGLGFTRTGTRPRHYEPDGDDAVLMELRLDPGEGACYDDR